MKWPQIAAVVVLTLVCAAAGPAFGSEGDDELRQLLVELTEDSDPDVRATALIALGHLGGDHSELLARFDSASSPQERIAAGSTRLLSGQREGAQLTAKQLLEARESYEMARTLSALLPEEKLLTLVEGALDDASAADRRELFRFLATRRNRLYNALTQRLTDNDEEIRSAALQAVRYAARAETLDVAQSLATNGNPEIRRQALELAKTLGKRPDLRGDVVEMLAELADDSDREIRRQAAEQLVKFGERRGAEVLVSSLADQGSEDRVETLEFLLENDATGDLTTLRELIEEVEASPEGRQRERHLLYELAATDADDAFVQTLREKYGSTDFDERLIAFRSLGRTGRDEVRSLLTQNLGAGRSDIRRLSARGLGHLGDPAVIPQIRSALSGERDRAVRLALIEAVGKLRDPQSVHVLRFLVTDRDREIKLAVIESFENLGMPESVQALELLLRDRDLDVQWRAFLALLDIDGERARRHVAGSLRNPPDTFAINIDPHGLTSVARRTLYEAMLANSNSRVRSTGAEHTLIHRDVLLPIARDMALSDRIEEDVRTDLVYLLLSENADEDLALLQRVVSNFPDQRAAELAMWHLAINPSPAFEETFTSVADGDEVDSVMSVIAHLGLANLRR